MDEQHWNDWKWQFRHRITSTDQLKKILPLTRQEEDEINTCLGAFRMAITPYYASLINPRDPNDPIRKQSVPSILETRADDNDLNDPLGEMADSPVPHVVHRYPDRVLLLVTLQCAMYCRHCTRRRAVGEEDKPITEAQLQKAIAYIRAH